MMKLSIIVPIYNVEPYLRRCIDSILAQTYRDFEIILVDDGSPDGCPAICDEYARKDSRVVVIHKENGGLSDARNAGLDIARGEYIGFVDSDDLIHPQMYEVLIHFLETCSADIAQCEWYCVYEERQPLFEKVNLENIEPMCVDATELLSVCYSNNVVGFNTSVCNKIYKKKIFDACRFPVGLYYEDEYIYLDTIEASRQIVTLQTVLYYYFQRQGSIIRSAYTPSWFYSRYCVHRKNILYFYDNGLVKEITYALEDYLMRFSRDKFAVYFKHPEYKKEFREVEQGFRREFWAILKNSKICEMKKLLAVTLIVCPKVAWKIAKKYFPECIYPFMR